jgi:hypothetical protein
MKTRITTISVMMLLIITIMLAIIPNTAMAIQTLKEYYDTNDDSFYTMYGATWYAQTFTTASSYHISNISLLLYKTLNPTNMTLHVRNTALGLPTGNDLVSVYASPSSLPTGAPYTWYSFELYPYLKVSSGYTYAIILNATGSTFHTVNWRADITSPTYAGGSYLKSSDSGASWTPASGRDFMFRCYGMPINFTLTATLPTNHADYFLNNTDTLRYYSILNLSFNYGLSCGGTIGKKYFFEDEEVGDSSLLSGNGSKTFNIFYPGNHYSNTVKNGVTYDWKVNLSFHGVYLNKTFDFTLIYIPNVIHSYTNIENASGTNFVKWNNTGFWEWANFTGNTTSLTWSNNHKNTTWTHISKLLTNNSWYIYDNDTGNTTGLTWENHHVNTTWSHFSRLLANNSWYIYDNDTGNMTGNVTGNYTVNISMVNPDGASIFYNWTGDVTQNNTNITFTVTNNMDIVCYVGVLAMNVVFDITQLGLVFLSILTFFCVFVGYLMNNSTGGVFLLVSTGLIFNLMVFTWVYFVGVFALSMTPLFVALIVLFAKDGVIRLKNKNLQKN